MPYTTESDISWSLASLGHTVFNFQEEEVSADDILLRCEQSGVELVLYTHTHGWITPGNMSLDDLWKALKERGIKTASFHLDYWKGLAREVDVGSHPFWRTDFVFTADGGSNDWYKEKGINHHWLPPGVVKRDCYWANPREDMMHDIVFVGTMQYHPEWQYRPQLINWLHETYGDRFAHYGNDGRRVVRQVELNQLYRSAKVIIGDSINLGFNHKDYWSDRVPETLGRGGFLIHPRVDGIEKHYTDKKHLILYKYGDFDELKNLIDHHLNDYIAREKIRLTGHEHVKNSQTYSNRMEEMLNIISGGKRK